jgi:preprotein translocase subunit SecA
MERLGMQEGEAIEHNLVTRVIENSQRKVEAHNFDMRKQLLEYDDVANDQRKVIYVQRDELMAAEDIGENIGRIRAEVLHAAIDRCIPQGSLHEQWDLAALGDTLRDEFAFDGDLKSWFDADHELSEEALRTRVIEAVDAAYAAKEAQVGAPVLRHFEKAIMLQVLDQLWKEHLASMDHLRQGIHLRGYAQKNPKQEYKREAFEMFFAMLERIKHDVTSILARVQIRGEQDVARVEEQRKPDPQRMQFQHAAAPAVATAAAAPPAAVAGTGAGAEAPKAAPSVRTMRKVGRNEPCPCGSGQKYKQCHGRIG